VLGYAGDSCQRFRLGREVTDYTKHRVLLWKRLFNLPGLRGLLGAENREMLSFGLWLAPLTTGAGSDVPFDVPFGIADGIVVMEIGIVS